MSTAPIPCNEPAVITAGDSVSWTKNLADYLPADGWSLLYCFRGNGVSLNIASTVLNSQHFISLATTDTEKLKAATYALGGFALLGNPVTQRVQFFNGEIIVAPDLQNAPADFDPRTLEKRTLDNINAVIAGRASSTILRSEVDGTRLDRIPFADLLNLQQVYQVKVRNQEIKLLQAQGRPTGRTIFASFTRPRFDGYTGQL